MGLCGLNKVLVVGGGIGGMSLAILLRREGLHVDLVEIDPNWRALGAGLTLNGATLRAFEQVGIMDQVVALGHVHGGRRSHHSDGRVIADSPAYRPHPGDMAAGGGVLRPVLHGILANQVSALRTNVRLGLSVKALQQTARGVEVGFSDGSGDGYDLVVGCDGLMSSIRQLVFPEAPKPRFTGQGCWRAVFDRPDTVETSWIFVDPGRKIGFNPVSQDKMYMFMLETVPDNPWREPAEWPAMLRERMLQFGGLVRQLAEQLDDGSLTNYRPLETLLLEGPWFRGRVALLGDAVHATTPHAGYGAGLAVEDAIVLTQELRTTNRLEQALSSYSTRRYARCATVLKASVALGEMEMANASAAAQLAAGAALFELTRQPF